MPNSKDIYKAKIYFRGKGSPFKTRPILVLANNGNMCTIVELTSVGPKEPPSYFDQFKEEVIGWNKYGLEEPSWAKCTNIHNVEGIELNNKIGVMGDDAFNTIVNRINEVN